tara:strand:- start:108057 stop:108908 length:852 start_codon:yes stop_codon:yes gene_type:complete
LRNTASLDITCPIFIKTPNEGVSMDFLRLPLASLALILLSTQAFAATSSKSADEFCSDRKGRSYIREYLEEDESRMSFRNHGGLINGGVCWWHSRFQRNAAYLTVYRPEQRRPTKRQAERLIKKIRKGREVITIPGFSSFSEFSRAFSSEIQDQLEKWQKFDGIIMQQWVVGLAGRSEVSAESMKDKMDELYEQVSQGDIVYQKLQIKGITAHAWLVIDMTKTSNGYELNVIDSNSPLTTTVYNYEEGDTSFHHYYYGDFVPYTGKDSELDRLKSTVKKYCRN